MCAQSVWKDTHITGFWGYSICSDNISFCLVLGLIDRMTNMNQLTYLLIRWFVSCWSTNVSHDRLFQMCPCWLTLLGESMTIVLWLGFVGDFRVTKSMNCRYLWYPWYAFFNMMREKQIWTLVASWDACFKQAMYRQYLRI